MNNQDIPQTFAILQESKKQWQDSTLENLEKIPFLIYQRPNDPSSFRKII